MSSMEAYSILAAINLSPDAWMTLGVIGLVVIALLTNRVGVDTAMLGGLTLIMLLGILPPIDAVSGFAHPAVVMIAGMFVIAAGLEETGGMAMLASAFLGKPKSVTGAQVRLMGPVSFMSALMNTTPIVAAYLPIVADWARKLKISPSKLYMPLSYAAIFGGICTMIGTSSNITVNELFIGFIETAPEESAAWLAGFDITARGFESRQFFWMTIVALPCTIVATLFVIATTKWLLPARIPAFDLVEEERRYTVEMLVQRNSPIVGKTIDDAGLRALPGLYLSEIERGDARFPAVAPDMRIEADDVLLFVGVIDSVVDLRKIRGLVPATDQVEKVGAPRAARTIFEAVISHNSPLVGSTVRESQFRTKYNAAIIAVARHGHRIRKKIGDIILQPGDTLLLVTHQGFGNAYRNSGDFYLISNVEEAREVRHERAWLSLGILALLITLLIAQPFGLHPIASVFLCAMLMVVTRCVTGTVARKSIRWQVLLVIGSAIGLGAALNETGAAKEIAHGILTALGNAGPHVILFTMFALTSIFAQFITNNGAAVLMFAIAMPSVEEIGVNPMPFVLAILIAAGCNLMSPVAYQTNLMVYGPGGYRFSDFLRMGVPITVVIGVIVTLLAPMVYPFHAT